MKKIPYGQCNFANMITRGYAYVDKTRYIEMLENENSTYHIMLRPRRFGKSLFLSILENYYDITKRDKFSTLFSNTYIGRNPTQDCGSYAMLSFDFSGLEVDDFGTFKASFSEEVERGVKVFLKRYRKLFFDTNDGDMFVSEPAPGISALISAFTAAEYAEIPVFVIVDEYDHFANRLLSMGDAYKDEVGRAGLVRAFYEALKKATKTIVRRIFITGVSPMMMVNDLTSGFNIADNLSLHEQYNEMFGFTRDEVDALTDEAGIDRTKIAIDMEYYYNGYMFSNYGKHKVYNSQMTLFYLNQVSRSNKEQKLELIDPNLRTSYERLQRLAENDENRKKLLQIIRDRGTDGNIHTAFSIDDLSKEEYFISLLFYLGMLTCGEGTLLRIPNYSVQTLYWEYLVDYISRACGDKIIDTSKLTTVINDLAYRGDVKPYIDFFVENFLRRLSNRDLRDFDEKYVKVMMLASLCLNSLYSPISEQENINGYTDIYLSRRVSAYAAKYEYVFEVKYIKKADAIKDEIEREFTDAFTQIEKYKKDERFSNRDDIKFWAFVFYGKDGCEMRAG